MAIYSYGSHTFHSTYSSPNVHHTLHAAAKNRQSHVYLLPDDICQMLNIWPADESCLYIMSSKPIMGSVNGTIAGKDDSTQAFHTSHTTFLLLTLWRRQVSELTFFLRGLLHSAQLLFFWFISNLLLISTFCGKKHNWFNFSIQPTSQSFKYVKVEFLLLKSLTLWRHTVKKLKMLSFTVLYMS